MLDPKSALHCLPLDTLHQRLVCCITEIDAQREEELENLLGVVDGMDLDGSKRVRRPTVLDLKSAVEAAEQQNAKRLKAGSLDSPELQHTESQTAPLPRHYYDEPDPAK